MEEVESPRQSHGLWVLYLDQLHEQVLCKTFELWGFGRRG